jgi:hypothetical protein
MADIEMSNLAISTDQRDENQQQASNANNKSKKFLYKRIREQIEFYFSDSNLSKDRFLKQEIQKSQDGCKSAT